MNDDDDVTWLLASLKTSFYQPEEIQIGMWFINSLYPGTDREFVEIWELTELPDEDQDSFFAKNGFPINVMIVFENENPDELDDVIAYPEDLGFIFNPDIELLEKLNIKHINTIIQDYEGDVFILINKSEYYYDGTILPELASDQLMILCYPFENDDGDDEEELIVE